MSRKRRRFSFLRFLLVLMIFVSLIACLFFGSKLLIQKIQNNNNQEKQQEIIPSSNEEVKIEVIDHYTFIDDKDELGFNFVIGKLRFTTSKESLYYDLSNLTNSERDIKLADTPNYLAKLKELNYDLKDYDVVTEVKANSNVAEVYILIPYVNKTGVLNVYNGEKLAFDLSHNVKNASSLINQISVEGTVIESNDYNITVTNSYQSTMMTHNSEEYNAAGINVYTFELNVSNIKDNVVIEKAYFVKDGSEYEYEALDDSYQSVKINNIINKKLTSGEKGALFFALYKNNDQDINYNGSLYIKFSNSNELVKISTTIK